MGRKSGEDTEGEDSRLGSTGDLNSGLGQERRRRLGLSPGYISIPHFSNYKEDTLDHLRDREDNRAAIC